MDRCMVLGIMIVSFVSAGNRRYFVTDSCGKVIGPDFGAYLEFDRDSQMEWKTNAIMLPDHVKGSIFKCIVLLRGMPSTGETRHMSLYFRYFTLKEKNLRTVESTIENCGKAYLSVYNGKDLTATEKYTLCGGSAFPSFFEFEGGEFISLEFYIDFRDDQAILDKSRESQPGLNSTAIATDPYPYPDVFFRIDVTSYSYDCNSTVPGVVMQCNDSRRCLDDSLRCDSWLSKNCRSSLHPKDNSDVVTYPPGNCYKATTILPTTPVPTPPPPPPDLTSIYVITSVLVLALVLVWCCWRPGYLPWRCARLRNIPCCRSCLACRNERCVKCYNASLLGPSPWFRSVNKTSPSCTSSNPDLNDENYGRPIATASVDKRPLSNKVYPIQRFNGRLEKVADVTGNDGRRAVEIDWLKLLTYDGTHLRGHR